MPNKSARPVALLLLAAVALAAIWMWRARHRSPEPISGTIEVDEVHVASRYGGRIEKINAQEGDPLHGGDVIVEMDAAELKASHDLAAAQIESAKRDAEAQEAQLEFARADAQRQQDLLKTRAVSPNETERATSTARALEKNVAASRMRIEQAHAQLAQIDAQLREMRIVAPGDCVLEVLNVKVGDVLGPNREVATLVLPQHLWVRIYVPEPWLGFLKNGDTVRVRVDSWRDREFPGVIEQINRNAEFTPRNVQTVEDRVKQVFGVKIRLDNTEDKLRAGMSADVIFPKVPPPSR